MREFKFIVLLFVLLSTHVVAQQLPSCPPQADDRYNVGPCTNLVPSPAFLTPTLGEQVGLTMAAQWAAISDCDTIDEVQEELVINITMNTVLPPVSTAMGVPGQLACDDVLFRITGQTSSGSFVFNIGTDVSATMMNTNRSRWILGKYSRTWLANDANGVPLQFVRYLLMGDMEIATPTPASPLVPDCMSIGTPDFRNRAAMHGYIDISCSNGSVEPPVDPVLQASLVLTHYDGCHSHLDTPINPRALVNGNPAKHVGTTYHLVAPIGFDFTVPLLNPVIPLNIVNSPFDAVRSTVSRVLGPVMNYGMTFTRIGPQCFYETSHTVNATTTSQDCVCTAITDVNRYHHQVISGNLNCNVASLWQSTFLVPEIPTGFFQYHLGQWTPSARFDVRSVHAFPVLGTISYLDQNDPSPMETIHIVFGINTYYAEVPTLFDPDRNLPDLFNTPGVVRTDTLLDFANSVGPEDRNMVGFPAYANILWMISR